MLYTGHLSEYSQKPFEVGTIIIPSKDEGSGSWLEVTQLEMVG